MLDSLLSIYRETSIASWIAMSLVFNVSTDLISCVRVVDRNAPKEIPAEPAPSGMDLGDFMGVEEGTISSIAADVAQATLEEAVRITPVAITVAAGAGLPVVVLVVAVTSVLFGLAHVNNGAPWWKNIARQGTGGAVMTVIFMKVAYSSGLGLIAGIAASSAYHAAWNLCVIPATSLVFGKSKEST